MVPYTNDSRSRFACLLLEMVGGWREAGIAQLPVDALGRLLQVTNLCLALVPFSYTLKRSNKLMAFLLFEGLLKASL
jgi:hypothetical protein